MKFCSAIPFFGLLIWTLCVAPVSATVNSGTVNYSLTLTAGCSVDSSGATTFFGTYPVDSETLYGVDAGSFQVNCAGGINYRVGVNNGVNNTLPGPPAMKSPSDPALIYFFIMVNGVEFGDTGLSLIDGSYIESNTALAIDGIGTASPATYNLTADIGLMPIIGFPAGTYTDTVTFTVAW